MRNVHPKSFKNGEFSHVITQRDISKDEIDGNFLLEAFVLTSILVLSIPN